MPTIETAVDPQVDPQAVKYLLNAGYPFPVDPDYYEKVLYIYRLLERLEKLSPVEHIPTKAVALICGLSAILDRRFAFVEHRPTHKLTEKSAIFSEKMGEITRQLGIDKPEIESLKTITLKVKHHGTSYYFLVSGIGDFHIDPSVKTNLAPAVQQILGAESNILNKGVSINPQEFHPNLELGLLPGIVSPFADLTRFGGGLGLRGLLYDSRMGIEGYVAVAVSATDTLIIDSSVFPTALNMWRGFYLNIPFRAF